MFVVVELWLLWWVTLFVCTLFGLINLRLCFDLFGLLQVGLFD